MKKLMLIFTVSVSLIACRPSKEQILEDWRVKRDSVAKHKCDSIKSRLDYIIALINAGATEKEATRLADSTDYGQNAQKIIRSIQ